MIPKLARVTVLSAAVLAAAVFATRNRIPLLAPGGMNPAKSKYSPGPTPKSITSVYEAAGKGYKVSVTNESATGKTQYSLHDQSRRSGLEGERHEPECGHGDGQAHRSRARWRS